MADGRGFTMLPSYYEALRPLPDDMRLQLYDAIMDYAFQSKEPEGLSPILAGYFTLLRPNIDNSIRHYSSSVENGRKGGRPKKPSENPTETQVKPSGNREKEKETEMDMETDTDTERERETAALPPAPARDSDGIVCISDADYKKLQTELGQLELDRVVSYLGRYCLETGRRYANWPAIIRRASSEQWGITSKPSGGSTTPGSFQPTQERIEQHNAWIDGFLEEQRKQQDGAKRFENLPGVIVL